MNWKEINKYLRNRLYHRYLLYASWDTNTTRKQQLIKAKKNYRREQYGEGKPVSCPQCGSWMKFNEQQMVDALKYCCICGTSLTMYSNGMVIDNDEM